MTTISHLWADVPTGATRPLPDDLSRAVKLRGPDPLRAQLLRGADAATATAFEAWRSAYADTFHLCDEPTARTVSAWLTRSGSEVVLTREQSFDQIAISALAYRCETELPDHPGLTEFARALNNVARLCRTRGTHAVLRMSITSYPVASA